MPMDWEKWQQKKDGNVSPPDLDKVVENIKRVRKKLPSGFILIALVVIVWGLSGFFVVNQRELGVIKRFGAYQRTTGPGLHYHLPAPIETVIKPEVKKRRRIEIGFITVNPGPPAQYRPVLDQSLMLTGDENIIDIWFIVQYRINNAEHYLFNVENQEQTVRDAAEAAMREVIGRNKIDEALTAGKFQIQKDTLDTLQKILDRYKSGLVIEEVQLQEVHPPQEVRAAFKDVASAREDQNRFINEAEGYANDLLPKAKGRAAEIVAQAEAYKAEKVERAQGDASRFLSVLKEYKKAKDVTRKRLYLETMEEILSRAKKFIFESGGQNALPLLPLQSLGTEPQTKSGKEGS